MHAAAGNQAHPPKASKAAALLPLSCPISAASLAKKPSTAARCAPASGGSAPLASADATAAEATTSGVMSPAEGGPGTGAQWFREFQYTRLPNVNYNGS